MTVADLALLVNRNDRRLRELISSSIDRLAEKTVEGFAHVDDRFRSVDARFQAIDERFARVDERFAQIDARFSQIEDRFQSVEMKILGVNSRIDILIDRVPSREEHGRLEGRMAALEARRRR